MAQCSKVLNMKLVYIENVRIPSERAHAYQITQQCYWFGKTGADVTLVNPKRESKISVYDYFHFDRKDFAHVLLSTFDILSTAPTFLKPIAYYLQRATFCFSLGRWAKEQHFDIWYTRDPAMVYALRDQKHRWVLEVHDDPATSVKRWDAIKNLVDRFIVISAGLRTRLIELGISEDRILIAPDGYNPQEYEHLLSQKEAREKLGLPLDAFVLLYAGSFFAWKGIDEIVQAWDETDPSMHLVLIGGPESDKRRIESLVSDSVRGRIHFIDRMPHADLVALYSAGDMGLLASSPRYKVATDYTSPLKLFEYLAGGLPLFASDVPTSREILNESVAHFFSPDPSGIRSGLQWIYEHRDDVKRMGGSATVFVKPYTWQSRAKKILDWISL